MSARVPNRASRVWSWLLPDSADAPVRDRRGSRAGGPQARVCGEPAPRRWAQGLDRPLG